MQGPGLNPQPTLPEKKQNKTTATTKPPPAPPPKTTTDQTNQTNKQEEELHDRPESSPKFEAGLRTFLEPLQIFH